jgi:hypothetical protein
VSHFGRETNATFQDFGEMILQSDHARGYVRVDWFTPDGLPTWGDGRLIILGEEGTIELRKYIDLCGRPGTDHVLLANQQGSRYIENGASGSIMATTAFYPGYPERIEIFGKDGAATLIGGALSLNLLNGHQEEVASDGGTGSGASMMDFPHDAHRALIAEFLDAIRNGREPRVSGAEALESQRIISAIVAAGSSKSAT